jgi:hypothetical protein
MMGGSAAHHIEGRWTNPGPDCSPAAGLGLPVLTQSKERQDCKNDDDSADDPDDVIHDGLLKMNTSCQPSPWTFVPSQPALPGAGAIPTSHHSNKKPRYFHRGFPF